METNITLTQFMDYFNTWYPILVPAAILAIILLGCILDWIRVFLISYADDFEHEVKYKWWPWVRNTIIGRIWHGTEFGYSKEYYWTEGRKEYKNRYVGFNTKQQAEKYLEGEDVVPNDCGKSMGGRVFLKHFGIWQLGILTFLLIAYKSVPVLTIGCAIGYGVLRLTRSVVRLNKKLKKHVADPDAHKDSSDE